MQRTLSGVVPDHALRIFALHIVCTGNFVAVSGVISSIRALSPISFAMAKALSLSLVVSTVRQCGFSNTLTT